VAQLELPQGVTMITDAEDIVVQCVEAAQEEEEAAAIGETAEPEVIGRKAEEGEEEEES
jgi:hypothetical protein